VISIEAPQKNTRRRGKTKIKQGQKKQQQQQKKKQQNKI
jgi:hypothetical protein